MSNSRSTTSLFRRSSAISRWTRQLVFAAGEFRDSPAARDDRECRDAGDREGLDVIAAEKQNHVGLRFVEHATELRIRRTV